MSKEKVLIIEDESEIRELASQVLSEKYHVLLAKNGFIGLEIASKELPNAIIVDILMPGMSGIQVCRELRAKDETKRIPILVLTALNDPEQRIEAFRAGADDYISKPFHPNELITRVESKINRLSGILNNPTAVGPSELTLGKLKINFIDLVVSVDSQSIEMGTIEYKILSLLARNSGQLVSRDEIANYIWGQEKSTDRTLDPHINSLRKKIANSFVELKTVYGHGYRLHVTSSP